MKLISLPLLTDPLHTSNYAVLQVSSPSTAPSNALAFLTLKSPGDRACNPRNAFSGTIYSNADRALDLNYREYEVTVENFIRLLTDRLGENKGKDWAVMREPMCWFT